MTSRTKAITSAVTLLGAIVAVGIYLQGSSGDRALTVRVEQGTFTVTLTEAGKLRSAESTTYRSPLEGREVEITYLAPEGSPIQEGDLLVRLDAAALRAELERATQTTRRSEMDLQAAEVDRDEAAQAVESVTTGAGTIAVEEARTNLRLAQARARRSGEEHERLTPLLTKGYITREEHERSALEREEAEARAKLAERALQVLVERTHPAEERTARLQLTRRLAQVEHLRSTLDGARAYERSVAELIAGCEIRARAPGLVIYEENLATMPRRKVRVGDRVTPSQGLVTLPDLRRMLVESSIRESDVHLVRVGQRALVSVDAFPDRQFGAVLTRLGALARTQESGGTRFDLTFELDATATPLRPAMNARVDVRVVEHAGALLVPVQAVFIRDGAAVCYVARHASFERRIVRTGGANGTTVEILSGLRAGERVSVAEPGAHAP